MDQNRLGAETSPYLLQHKENPVHWQAWNAETLAARATEELADVIYVTSDNPRTEDAGEIVRQITDGFTRPRKHPVIVEADRRAAIGMALEDAQSGDVVLVAGKGHENYQEIGATRHHFDDVEEVKMALQRVSKF